jgi:four helix bundle protein
MDRDAEDLKRRTKAFDDNILSFIETLPKTVAAQSVAGQLARAGNGVAGNYRSACRARSHTEFTARLGIVLDEADESELWLSACHAKNWGDREMRQQLVDEALQLRAIFGKACATARSNEKGKRRRDGRRTR